MAVLRVPGPALLVGSVLFLLLHARAAAVDNEGRELLQDLLDRKLEAMAREQRELSARLEKLEEEKEALHEQLTRHKRSAEKREKAFLRRLAAVERKSRETGEGTVLGDGGVVSHSVEDLKTPESLSLEETGKGKTQKSRIASGKLHDTVSPKTNYQPGAQSEEKRSDDVGTLEPVISHMTQQLNEVTADVQALKNANALYQQTRGSSYIRWGSHDCANSSQTVYTGYIGGSWYNSPGAGNHLCLPSDPVFDNHVVPRYGAAELFAAEYQTCDEPSCDLTSVCAVCHVPRSAVVMVPARGTCWPGWTLEYAGYVMAGHPTHPGSSEFICVDKSESYVPGTQGDDNGNLLHYTWARCGSLPCPPYVDKKIVECAVCSK